MLADFRVLALYFLGGTADKEGMETNANPTATLARIMGAIDAGATVIVATMTRHTSYSPKTVAGIRKHGAEPFKVLKDGALAMLSGWSKGSPKFDRISLADGRLLVGLEVRS